VPVQARHDQDSRTTSLLVVIPCLNEAGHIEGVVRQLLDDDTTTSAGPLELLIVVADGGSTDGTQQLVQALAAADPRVRLVANPGRIQSSAVNRAVEAFGDDYEYFVRLDAHSQYPPGFCAALFDEAHETGADSVVVAMRTAGTATFQRAAAAAQNSPLGNGGSAHRNAGTGTGSWVDHGHHALMRVSAFRAVGGYDETFTHNEDAELDVRLGQAGHRIWLTPRTWSVYFPRDTPSALLKQYINYGSGRAANVLKHGTVPKVRQLLPLMVAPAVAVAMAARIVRIPMLSRMAQLPAFTWALGCLGYGAALARKQNDPAAAMAGPAAMLMHLGWSIGFWRKVIAYLKTRG
jgi:succinoglycan biosynthesis protein ExoA